MTDKTYDSMKKLERAIYKAQMTAHKGMGVACHELTSEGIKDCETCPVRNTCEAIIHGVNAIFVSVKETIMSEIAEYEALHFEVTDEDIEDFIDPEDIFRELFSPALDALNSMIGVFENESEKRN